MLDYIRDAAEIYRQSFATIRAEADLSRFPDDVARVVVRLIHTCGQVDVAEHVAFSDDVVARAHAALAAGAPVLCDSSMVAAGITAARLPAANEVVSLVADPRAAGAGRANSATPGRRPGWNCGPTASAARWWRSAMRRPHCSGCWNSRRRGAGSGRGARRAGRVRRLGAVQAELIARPRGHVLSGGHRASRRQRDGRGRRQRDRERTGMSAHPVGTLTQSGHPRLWGDCTLFWPAACINSTLDHPGNGLLDGGHRSTPAGSAGRSIITTGTPSAAAASSLVGSSLPRCSW